MDIAIGEYILRRRTEYSKLQVIDKETGTNVSNTSIGGRILEDYTKQISNPSKYFNISTSGKTLLEVTSNLESDNIKYLFIPKGITDIKDEAVSHKHIEYVGLPDTLTEIGVNAFEGCINLKTINIPDSVKAIGMYCFDSCKSLEYIELPKLTELSAGMFFGCCALKEITLPNTLQSLDFECFKLCSSLEKIIIPDGVSQIDDEAFSGCTSLNYVKLPPSLKILGQAAFAECEELEEIELPDSIKKMGRGAFFRTHKLKSITLPKDFREIGESPFAESGVKEFIFKHDLTFLKEVGTYESICNIMHETNVKKITIDKNVSKITPKAFKKLGHQIKTIDYIGTEDDYQKFRKNNQKLMETLWDVKTIHFVEENLDVKENTIDNISK